jgi:hypothetical protein
MPSLLPTLHHIVEQAKKLKNLHTSEKNAPVNYACIFCQNEQEYEQFYTAASEMGKVIKETPSGELFHIRPIDTVAGKLQLVKIRKPDPTRPERGDADFTVADYETFKKAHLGKDGFKLIGNRPDIIEMIELMDPSFDVRAYFSQVPLDAFYKLI